MNVRIISGTYGGRIIGASDGHKTHPMGERIRNALFNSLHDAVKGATVLDAFAGTGAIGIEAISRGAESAVFIERDRIAQKVIDENIKLLGIDDRAKIVKAPVASWIDTYDGDFFDIIFADPPYHDVQFSTVTKLMGLLKPSALMVLSHPGRDECPTKTGVVVVDNRSYGDATLTLFRREE
ncbi:MAG: 16S rRNA (guanine(966)-N(2))-methyltransferase RsmD [Candidatus Saccharimonadales bacterium]